jgi:hypothetical protein
MTPIEAYTAAVRELAEQLARQEVTVDSGPEAGASLWEMLTPEQREFLVSRTIGRAHRLLSEGAAVYAQADVVAGSAA